MSDHDSGMAVDLPYVETVIMPDLTAWNEAIRKVILASEDLRRAISAAFQPLIGFSIAMERLDAEVERKRAYRARFGPDPRDVQRALEETGAWTDSPPC